MDANFSACLALVLASEGSFVDDPQDAGGATNLGVTLTTWSGWIGHAASIAEIEALTVTDVTPLYRADFWAPAHCDALPAGVDLMVFDCAVNSGVGRAIRTVQQAAGVAADGLFGPQTAQGIARAQPASVIEQFADTREAFYHSLPKFSRFGRGWLARLERTKNTALGMAA